MSRLWMIAYDIVDHRTRRQVEKTLLDHATRVQESVFEGRLTHAESRALRRDLAEIIDHQRDSVRFYPLCAWCQEGHTWQGQGRRQDDPPYYLF